MIKAVKEPDPTSAGLDWGLLDGVVGPHVRLLRNLLTSRSLAALAPFGLPPGSLSLLTLIHANPGCSQSDLAQATGLNKSAIVAILDELEQRDLALRGRASNDRRRNCLSLTSAGEEQIHQMLAVQIAQEAPIRTELSKAELLQLISLLTRANIAVARTSKE